MNHVGIVGRTTKDLSLRQLSEGRVQTTFTVAINRQYKNSEGVNEADFVQCIAWGKLAELLIKHCGKGSLIGIKGRLQTGSYINRENQKVFTTDVVAEEIRFYALKPVANATEAPAIPKDFVLPEQESELVKSL
ncbi:single-stranded DNA-binding protein [Solibacillus daqui]|uniref:single-stranded DNA-binding protein n=1 Tax=Solibacillus daqui TaxID=2912187 RepID=UPI002365DEF6|nr:single-stranded DNA-binding protein [Solibacillus daqui]